MYFFQTVFLHTSHTLLWPTQYILGFIMLFILCVISFIPNLYCFRRDSEQMAKFQAFKDSATCIPLSQDCMPSICFYTLLNTNNRYHYSSMWVCVYICACVTICVCVCHSFLISVSIVSLCLKTPLWWPEGFLIQWSGCGHWPPKSFTHLNQQVKCNTSRCPQVIISTMSMPLLLCYNYL